MPRSFLLILLAAWLPVTTGCSDAPAGQAGQLGQFRFELATPTCEGCTVDREILAGSHLEIGVHGINPRNAYQVRSTAPRVATFHSSPHCAYVREDGCRELVSVETRSAGDVDLEIVDEWTGTVLDRVTLKVRDAAAIETNVKATGPDGARVDLTPGSGGFFEVKVGTDVEILASARSATGTELVATAGAIESAYADERVVGPRKVPDEATPGYPGHAPGYAPGYAQAYAPQYTPGGATGGATEYAKAKSPGVTVVSVAGRNAKSDLSFRVVR